MLGCAVPSAIFLRTWFVSEVYSLMSISRCFSASHRNHWRHFGSQSNIGHYTQQHQWYH